MDIVQVIGVGLVALVIIMTLKQNKPDFVIYVELIAGVIIMSLCFDKITAVVNYVYEISSKIQLSNRFIGIMVFIMSDTNNNDMLRCRRKSDCF